MFSIGFTGHRPDKMYGYNLSDPRYIALKNKVKNIIKELHKNHNEINGIVGGALGFDTLMFDALYELKQELDDIYITMAVPFEQQYSKWPADSKRKYLQQRDNADIVIYVDTIDKYKVPNTAEGMYESKKLFKRNEYIVDNSDILIACINDLKSGSGHCAKYFKSTKPDNSIIYINPDNLEIEVNKL